MLLWTTYAKYTNNVIQVQKMKKKIIKIKNSFEINIFGVQELSNFTKYPENVIQVQKMKKNYKN